MLVLDFPRAMPLADPVIVVPPFHSGHLGFIPGTMVNVAILSQSPVIAEGGDGRRGRPHPEIVVSQFGSDIRQMAVLSVTLQNRIGVVERLTTAVSSLGINIELQESSSIDRLNEHQVTLVLDMEPLYDLDVGRHVPRNVRSLYDHYRELLPIGDAGAVRLFETVTLHCSDVLAWRRSGDHWVPAIDIYGIPRRALDTHGRAKVQRIDGFNHIRLPDYVTAALRRQMQRSSDADVLTYIFVSDTSQRNLRVFFMDTADQERLFHLAFHHNNVPGALSTILRLVADARFNIVTSLLRKQSPLRSVWEAVLRYDGDALPPSLGQLTVRGNLQDDLEWVAEQIRYSVRGEPLGGVPCDIMLDRPAYPRVASNVDESPHDGVQITADIHNSGWESSDTPTSLLDEAKRRLIAQSPRPKHHAQLSDLLDNVERRLRRSEQPTIFMSYPTVAKAHASLLRDALEPYFETSDYTVQNGERILEQVDMKIADADFFLGVWHHEEKPDGGAVSALSPWMPFEYGIARTLGKRSLIIHSSKLPEHIWNRIDPGIALPEYSDLGFGHTIKLVVDYCLRNFRND